MKALLICPAARDNVAALSESFPLSNLPLFGESLVEYWLTHLATLGAKEVFILTSDRSEQVRVLVDDGVRWGLRVEVFSEIRELTLAEALAKYQVGREGAWLPAPHDAILMDHLPGAPECPLFTSYADVFKALTAWTSRAAMVPDCIGLHEIKPQVWVGLHAHISTEAELRAPCWIGENVYVGPGAIIGPGAIVERNSFVERGAEIAQSVVGAETFVGEFTQVRHSIALGNTLVDWKHGSMVKVPDDFLMCSLAERKPSSKATGFFYRPAAALFLLLSRVTDWLLFLRRSVRDEVK
jgi:NDP-sugar pyrophosphorylase family protein